jgi:hypothetical protein
MNHHYRGRSSRDKNCEDNPPRGNNEKRTKSDLAKQDLKVHTQRVVIFQHHHLRQEGDLVIERKPEYQDDTIKGNQ